MRDTMMSRRSFLHTSAAALSLMGVTATGLTGCGGSSSSDNGELNIFIWTEYVPDSVISDFESEFGITVNASTFSTNEDMLAKFTSGEDDAYDLLQPSDYMVKLMIDQGLLQKMDTTTLENIGNIGSQYLDQDYDKGNKYSVPYMGSVTAIAVNTDKITDTITSYADLFDAKYAGDIVMLDDYREVLGIAAESIGVSNNETDESKLELVRAQVMKLKDNIKVYDSDSPKSALINGDCVLGAIWSAEIALAQRENPAIQIVFPKEGAEISTDNWVIPTNAKNVDNAMKFLDYMMRPEVAKAISDDYPYVQPNTAAIALMDDDFKDNVAENVPAEVFESGHRTESLPSDTLKIYNDIWTDLKS